MRCDLGREAREGKEARGRGGALGAAGLADTDKHSRRRALPPQPSPPPTPPPPHPLAQSDWSVVQRGYYAHVLGEAPNTFKDPVEAVRTLKQGNEVSGGMSDALLQPACSPRSAGWARQRLGAPSLSTAGTAPIQSICMWHL